MEVYVKYENDLPQDESAILVDKSSGSMSFSQLNINTLVDGCVSSDNFSNVSDKLVKQLIQGYNCSLFYLDFESHIEDSFKKLISTFIMDIFRQSPKSSTIMFNSFEIFENFIKDVLADRFVELDQLNNVNEKEHSVRLEEILCESPKDCLNHISKDSEKLISVISIIRLCSIEVASMDEEKLVMIEGENTGSSLFQFFSNMSAIDPTSLCFANGAIYQLLQDKLEGNCKTSWCVGIPNEEREKEYSQWIAKLIVGLKTKKTYPLINSFALRKYLLDMKMVQSQNIATSQKSMIGLSALLQGKRVDKTREVMLKKENKTLQTKIEELKIELSALKEKSTNTNSTNKEKLTKFELDNSNLIIRHEKLENRYAKILNEKLELQYNLIQLLTKKNMDEKELVACHTKISQLEKCNKAISQSMKTLNPAGNKYLKDLHAAVRDGRHSFREEKKINSEILYSYLVEFDKDYFVLSEKERALNLYKIAELEGEISI
ncbi:hypothetical protein HDV06_002473 [Boothiomyces sp. JEL0866]|nr:hypothetical protein HDV06_002473 [Boothiomyces sp. JEL0866]